MLGSTRIIARRVGRGRASGALSVLENYRGTNSLTGNETMVDNGQSARKNMKGSRLDIRDSFTSLSQITSGASVAVPPFGILDLSANGEDDDGG